jgi:hypothetical protein
MQNCIVYSTFTMMFSSTLSATVIDLSSEFCDMEGEESGFGVFGEEESGVGVFGEEESGFGVFGEEESGFGVFGEGE